MKDEEKKATEYADSIEEKKHWSDENDSNAVFTRQDVEDGFLAGLKVGRSQWNYPSKGELPRKSDSILCELMPVFVAVKVGYRVSTYGTYWNLKLGKFECLDEVYAWCYTPEPPELPKESK